MSRLATLMTAVQAALLLVPLRLHAEANALVQSAAQSYREGRYMDALRDMSEVLEADPENETAKNYVWTIARRMSQEEAKATLKPGEMEQATALAMEDLQDRRRRAGEVLEALKDASRRSDNPRGPADLLEGLSGLDKQLGPDFQSEGTNAQARAYFNNILGRLSAAIERRAFVSSKDFFRAQGYLAYYGHRWDEAAGWWEKAAKEDPADAALKKDLESLKGLITRKKEEKELQDLARQADTYSRTGYLEEAYQTWRQIFSRRPDYPGAREKSLVAKVALEKSRQAADLRRRTDQGVAEFKAGHHLAAAQIWLEVLQVDPTFDQARAWLKLVGPRLEGERPISAPSPLPSETSSARRSAAQDPAKAEELYRKGLLLYSDDKLEEAVQLWRQSVELDPTLTKARQALEHAERELTFR